mmetsp:Transcript_6565/g.20684  ORF Transcript_6565/g.20684 Transcript_6565/m.20684 type:complete len:121 (-) Transcript_6565:54-416(-)
MTCGVGITFVEDENGALFVKSFVEGGSAAECGQIERGDVLVEVDGLNVYCHPPQRIGTHLLGPEGSQVQLGFQRSETGPIRRVLLVRNSHTSTSPAAYAQACSLSPASYTNQSGDVSART